MTTIELFERVGRRARGGDFTKLSASEKRDVLQSINRGLQQIYDKLPIYFKELTEGFVLPAAVTVSIPVTQYSATIGSSAFTDDQLGRTIVIDGDPAWNQVVGSNALLSPYMGITGTVNATIYGDAFYSKRFPFDRILGNPKFNDTTFAPLLRTEMNRASVDGVSNMTLFAHSVGLPRIWWTQPLGNSQGNEPLVVLKFLPVPDQAYSMSIRAAYWPKRLTLADYDSAAIQPVPDQFIESALIPLSVQALRDTPVFEVTGADPKRLDESAAQAAQFLDNQPKQPFAPFNRIGTPWGY